MWKQRDFARVTRVREKEKPRCDISIWRGETQWEVSFVALKVRLFVYLDGLLCDATVEEGGIFFFVKKTTGRKILNYDSLFFFFQSDVESKVF